MTTFISREAIQGAQDIPWEDVPVDEWQAGGVIRIMGLNAKDASAFSKRLVQLDPKGNVRSLRMDDFMAQLIVMTAVNEKFERLFTEADVPWLNTKSAKVLKRLADAAQRLSGMENTAIADAAKNSEGMHSGAEPIGLP